MTNTADTSVDLPERDYGVAMTQKDFMRMKNDQDFRITDWTGMGPMSEFDVYVNFVVTRP